MAASALFFCATFALMYTCAAKWILNANAASFFFFGAFFSLFKKKKLERTVSNAQKKLKRFSPTQKKSSRSCFTGTHRIGPCRDTDLTDQVREKDRGERDDASSSIYFDIYCSRERAKSRDNTLLLPPLAPIKDIQTVSILPVLHQLCLSLFLFLVPLHRGILDGYYSVD